MPVIKEDNKPSAFVISHTGGNMRAIAADPLQNETERNNNLSRFMRGRERFDGVDTRSAKISGSIEVAAPGKYEITYTIDHKENRGGVSEYSYTVENGKVKKAQLKIDGNTQNISEVDCDVHIEQIKRMREVKVQRT